jgi:hypothetical protein
LISSTLSRPAQPGLVPQVVLERALGTLVAEEEVDCLRAAEFDEGERAHALDRLALRLAARAA